MPQLERILCVEDDPDIRAIAEFSLERIGGFRVDAVESGQSALAELPLFKPQLILLDVMMPGMDGPETLAAIRALPEFAQIPIAFMTSKVQPAEIDHFKSLGAVDVIAKPFEPTTLPDRIRQLWGSISV